MSERVCAAEDERCASRVELEREKKLQDHEHTIG